MSMRTTILLLVVAALAATGCSKKGDGDKKSAKSIWKEVKEIGVKIQVPEGTRIKKQMKGMYSVKGPDRLRFQIHAISMTSTLKQMSGVCDGKRLTLLEKKKLPNGVLLVKCKGKIGDSATTWIRAALNLSANKAVTCFQETDGDFDAVIAACGSLTKL